MQVLTEVGKETIVGWIRIRLFNIAQEGKLGLIDITPGMHRNLNLFMKKLPLERVVPTISRKAA
jgi:hypothetical protein